jgi:hypothetical protein
VAGKEDSYQLLEQLAPQTEAIAEIKVEIAHKMLLPQKI